MYGPKKPHLLMYGPKKSHLLMYGPKKLYKSPREKRHALQPSASDQLRLD